MRLLRLFISTTGMFISFSVFILGALIHLGIILAGLPAPANLGTALGQGDLTTLLSLFSGIFEGVGAAWFIFFLLQQAVRPAIIRLIIFFFLIASAVYGAAYFLANIVSPASLVRGFGLATAALIASALFTLDLATSFFFQTAKNLLSRKPLVKHTRRN